MSTKAQSFVGLTIVTGVCLVTYCLAGEARVVPSSAYLGAVLLAVIASTLKVRLPGITGTISVNFLFILIGIADFTMAETLTMGCIAILMQCLWRSKSGPRLVQVAFNVAALAISIGAAYQVSHFA